MTKQKRQSKKGAVLVARWKFTDSGEANRAKAIIQDQDTCLISWGVDGPGLDEQYDGFDASEGTLRVKGAVLEFRTPAKPVFDAVEERRLERACNPWFSPAYLPDMDGFEDWDGSEDEAEDFGVEDAKGKAWKW